MSVAAERAKADAAKLRLEATVAETKARLAPAALAEDAKDKAQRFVRTKPAVAAAAGTGALLLILRRPLRRLFRRRKSDPSINEDAA